jgi:maltose O-acetyltransferase
MRRPQVSPEDLPARPPWFRRRHVTALMDRFLLRRSQGDQLSKAFRALAEPHDPRTMTQVRKLLRVAGEELALDPRRIATHVVSALLPQNSFNRARTVLLRSLGLRMGATSLIAGSLHITGSGPVRDRLSIGPGCYITGPLHIDLTAAVTIGARVYMGYEVMLITADHELGDFAQRCGRRVFRPIWIEDGVWLGSRVVVLPGVRIGRGAVIAAGAVVTRNVPPNALVGGVPARFVRDLEDVVAGHPEHDPMSATTRSPADANP